MLSFESMEFEDLKDEIDLFVERAADGNYVARVFHKLSGTIKISEPCGDADAATKNAVDGLMDLLKERMKVLGK